MFDKLKKEGEVMMEENSDEKVQTTESVNLDSTGESSSEIGIGELMGKRAKLEEAIDYVGLND